MHFTLNLSEAWNIFIRGELIWHEIIHLLAAFPFALYLYRKTNQIKSFLLVFLVTLFIDIDHLADYLLYYGTGFNLANFLKLDYLGFGKKIEWALVPFHSWEWLALLFLINIRNGWQSGWRVILFGYLPHMIHDFINVGNFVFYFLSYRLLILEKLL